MSIIIFFVLALLASTELHSNSKTIKNGDSPINLKSDQIGQLCSFNAYSEISYDKLVTTKDTIFPNFQNLKPHSFYKEDSFLVEIIDPFELAYITWGYYRLRYNSRGRIKGKIKKLYTIIAIDKDQEKAYKIEVVRKNEKIRRGNSSKQINTGKIKYKTRMKSKSTSNYKMILNKFLIAEALGFDRLDGDQLHNKLGPVNERGLAQVHDWNHRRNAEVILKSKGIIGKISSYAPKRLYELYPKLYPDRKKFVLVYELFKEQR